MRLPQILALVFALAFTAGGVPAARAATDAASEVDAPRVPAPIPLTSVEADAVDYAAREAKAPAAAQFRGGERVVLIGASTLSLILIVVILVILL